jgi:hypothetical protein
MIEIKPEIQQSSSCPHCSGNLKPNGLIWHGMHICVNQVCTQCKAKLIEDLEVGHAINCKFQIDLEKGLLFGVNDDNFRGWLGEPLLKSLHNPQKNEIKIRKEQFKECQQVVILNCIDYLYGHSLLKLLNAQKYIDKYPEYGLIIIVPKILRWMIIDGVAEIWTVDIPLKYGQLYYQKFHHFVSQELKRFEKVYVSKAFSHPSKFDITKFTKISRHDWAYDRQRVTFIWREDRVWINPFIFRILRKLGLSGISFFLQQWKIKRLFKIIALKLPSAKFTVVGLGKRGKFPKWIEDSRVDNFDEETERKLCQLYSDSSLVIGIHGSNMLLPSGHAGMTIDLMPTDRVGNFAQDILYQEQDLRLAAFKYRYIFTGITIKNLANIAISMILKYPEYLLNMMADKK